MAFAIRDFSVLAYANGFTLWHYKARQECLAVAAETNFFADASDMLAVGDMVMVSATDGARIVVVAESGSGAVSTAALA